MEKLIIKTAHDRLDTFLTAQFPHFSRTEIKQQIKQGNILLNKQAPKASQKLQAGDQIYIKHLEKTTPTLISEPFNFQILYEDKAVIAINKPTDTVVHPGNDGQHLTKTVANAMLSKFTGTPADPMRPGIVHRLDKDTSGILLLAKTPEATESLQKQFKERKTKKTYLTLVYGTPTHPIGIIDSPIGRDLKNRKQMSIQLDGKEAITKYKVIKQTSYKEHSVSLLKVQIVTGRTHQIRVHMKAIKHPVIGDQLYGNKKINTFFQEEFKLTNQFLLAEKLQFTSPDTKKEVNITCPLPDLFQEIIEKLFKK